MYKVSPILDPNTPVEISKRMYSMQVINDVNIAPVSLGGEESAEFTTEIEELEKQHAKLDENLRLLQGKIEALAKTRGIKLHTGEGVSSSSLNGKISIAVHADVNKPPLTAFLVVLYLRSKGHKVYVTSHVHSSVIKATNDKWKQLCSVLDNNNLSRGSAEILISLVWKENLLGQCVTFTNQSFSAHPLIGEAMLIRYILYVFDAKVVRSSKLNSFIDLIDLNLLHGSQKERPKALKLVQDVLSKSGTIPGDGIGEVYLWSAIRSSNTNGSLPPALKKIILKCEQKDIYKAVLKCL